MIGSEAVTPYQRPPLSKGDLKGNDDPAKPYVQPREWYAEHNVELRLSTTVTAVDPAPDGSA